METAKNIIAGIIDKNLEVKARVSTYGALENWGEITGSGSGSWVNDLSGGVVSVFTENPSLGQEISFTKSNIIDKINSIAGMNTVKDIKVRIKSGSHRKTENK